MPTVAPAPAAVPSAVAMRAQVQMLRLLDEHFNAEKGRYADGWDDARVAKECHLAPAMVSQFRIAGFGAIKESPELAGIRADLAALKKLFADTLTDLEARLRKAGVQ